MVSTLVGNKEAKAQGHGQPFIDRDTGSEPSSFSSLNLPGPGLLRVQSQARLTLPLKSCWAWLSFSFLSLNNLLAWVQSNTEQISQVLVSLMVAEMGSEGKKSARSRVNCQPLAWRSLLQTDPEGVFRDQFCPIRGLACLQKISTQLSVFVHACVSVGPVCTGAQRYTRKSADKLECCSSGAFQFAQDRVFLWLGMLLARLDYLAHKFLSLEIPHIQKISGVYDHYSLGFLCWV